MSPLREIRPATTEEAKLVDWRLGKNELNLVTCRLFDPVMNALKESRVAIIEFDGKSCSSEAFDEMQKLRGYGLRHGANFSFSTVQDKITPRTRVYVRIREDE